MTEEEQAFYQDSLDETSEVNIQDTYMIGEEDDDRMEKVLSYCIPHTNYKADYILLMLKQLYRDIHAKQWSDKDSLMFQRIEMVHDLLSGLTHHLLNKMTHTIYQFLHKKMTGNIQRGTILRLLARTTTITDGLQFALGTGNWNTPSFDGRQRVGSRPAAAERYSVHCNQSAKESLVFDQTRAKAEQTSFFAWDSSR